MDNEQLKDGLKKYKFYHIIQLGNGISTPGWKEFLPLQEPIHKVLRSLDLRDKRFLDIGCRDGLFSFEAEKMGASSVIGIDNNISEAAVEFLIPYFQSNVQMHELSVLDLSPKQFGIFDVILFAGVLYHLRYPFWALKLITDVLAENGFLIIETGVLVDDNKKSLLFCPTGSESPYEPTSCTFFNLKGLVDTLFSLGLVTEHVGLLNKSRGVNLHNQSNQTIEIALTDEKIELPTPPKVEITPAPEHPEIDRAIILCRKSSNVIDLRTQRYWDGCHRFHDVNKFYDGE